MPSRNAATARQVWWASVPVWSIGFLSPVPFLIYAITHRTRRDWAVSAGYLAALAAAKDKLDRRKEARHLVATNPALARDLRIGRPDLPRDYDDGGLVDVNHVPVGVFSSGLGLTPIEARDVVAARDKLGRFVSAEELCEYTQLSPDRIDGLRDLMIFP
jgi:DNA uptake protein ComE-like DNA-binding protein